MVDDKIQEGNSFIPELKPSRNKFACFLLSFVLLNLADALTTIIILSNGGVEVNILPAYIIESYGLCYFFFFKLFASSILGFLCIFWQRITNFLIIFFALVCSWNTAVIVSLLV